MTSCIHLNKSLKSIGSIAVVVPFRPQIRESGLIFPWIICATRTSDRQRDAKWTIHGGTNPIPSARASTKTSSFNSSHVSAARATASPWERRPITEFGATTLRIHKWHQGKSRGLTAREPASTAPCTKRYKARTWTVMYPSQTVRLIIALR